MRIHLNLEKFALLILLAPLFTGAHLFNGWFFEQMMVSSHISWVYLPAFLRIAYVLVLGPGWGFITLFVGAMLLGGGADENMVQAISNAGASAICPVLALWLFRVLKERKLQIHQLSDLIQMCVLYSLLNALVHHMAWAYQQPNQLLTASQLPIMVIGDLAGAVMGAVLFTFAMRRLGLYQLLSRLSSDKAPDLND